MSDILLIGSCEPFSGKSALVLGIAKRLLKEKKKGLLENFNISKDEGDQLIMEARKIWLD